MGSSNASTPSPRPSQTMAPVGPAGSAKRPTTTPQPWPNFGRAEPAARRGGARCARRQRSVQEHARLAGALRHQGVHSIGRYGGWTYCSIEDNIVEARELVAGLD